MLTNHIFAKTVELHKHVLPNTVFLGRRWSCIQQLARLHLHVREALVHLRYFPWRHLERQWSPTHQPITHPLSCTNGKFPAVSPQVILLHCITINHCLQAAATNNLASLNSEHPCAKYVPQREVPTNSSECPVPRGAKIQDCTRLIT